MNKWSELENKNTNNTSKQKLIKEISFLASRAPGSWPQLQGKEYIILLWLP